LSKNGGLVLKEIRNLVKILTYVRFGEFLFFLKYSSKILFVLNCLKKKYVCLHFRKDSAEKKTMNNVEFYLKIVTKTQFSKNNFIWDTHTKKSLIYHSPSLNCHFVCIKNPFVKEQLSCSKRNSKFRKDSYICEVRRISFFLKY